MAQQVEARPSQEVVVPPPEVASPDPDRCSYEGCGDPPLGDCIRCARTICYRHGAREHEGGAMFCVSCLLELAEPQQLLRA